MTVEIVRGWMSTGFLAALVFMVARLGKPVADYLIETHRLRAQEKKDDRQGYGELIEALTKEVHDLRSENTAMRREIRELHGMIDGLVRGDLQARRSAQAHLLEDVREVAPATAEALAKMNRGEK